MSKDLWFVVRKPSTGGQISQSDIVPLKFHTGIQKQTPFEGGSGYKTSSTSFHIPHTNEYGCMWHRALLPCSYELEVLKKRREPGTIYHNNLSVFCAISDDEMISSLRLQLEIIHYDYIITKHLLLSCMHH